jgi:serine/threonine protein kinase
MPWWAGWSKGVMGVREKASHSFHTHCRLRHMNIISFFGVTTYPDPLIILELMAGGSLHESLHPNHRLAPTLCWRISKDVAAGLLYLHTREPPMVHRDLTSSNVLLTAPVPELALRDLADNRPFAKLSDFGLTRSAEFYMTACTGNLYVSVRVCSCSSVCAHARARASVCVCMCVRVKKVRCFFADTHHPLAPPGPPWHCSNPKL